MEDIVIKDKTCFSGHPLYIVDEGYAYCINEKDNGDLEYAPWKIGGNPIIDVFADHVTNIGGVERSSVGPFCDTREKVLDFIERDIINSRNNPIQLSPIIYSYEEWHALCTAKEQ